MSAEEIICEECRVTGGIIKTMEEIARKTAEEVVELHKKDMELRLHQFRDELLDGIDDKLSDKFKAFLGEQTPLQHYDSHRRLDRLLKFLDDMQSSIISKALQAFFWVVCGGGVVLLVFWDRIVK